MHKFSKYYWITVLICVIGLIFSGCSSNLKAANEGKDKNKPNQSLVEVKIPDMNMGGLLSVAYIADELGIFQEEGIKPVFTGIIPAGQDVASVVSGNNDVGFKDISRTILAIQSGAKLKIVVAGTETSKEYPHVSFYALENSSIKTAQDLVGKKVGVSSVGGTNEALPYEWLRQNGISDPKGKINFILVPSGNEEQVLRSGEVDVISLRGTPREILSHGGMRALVTDYDVWGIAGGASPWYFSEKFIKEKPDVVRHFVKAIARTEDWINANLDKAIIIQAKRLNIDPIKINTNYYSEHGVVKSDSVQLWLDIMKKNGELKKDLKAEDVFTNEFNDYAK